MSKLEVPSSQHLQHREARSLTRIWRSFYFHLNLRMLMKPRATTAPLLNTSLSASASLLATWLTSAWTSGGLWIPWLSTSTSWQPVLPSTSVLTGKSASLCTCNWFALCGFALTSLASFRLIASSLEKSRKKTSTKGWDKRMMQS